MSVRFAVCNAAMFGTVVMVPEALSAAPFLPVAFQAVETTVMCRVPMASFAVVPVPALKLYAASGVPPPPPPDDSVVNVCAVVHADQLPAASPARTRTDCKVLAVSDESARDRDV